MRVSEQWQSVKLARKMKGLCKQVLERKLWQSVLCCYEDRRIVHVTEQKKRQSVCCYEDRRHLNGSECLHSQTSVSQPAIFDFQECPYSQLRECQSLPS